MKHFITAIATLTIVLALTGCSSLYNSTPEFAKANDAYFKVKSLAVPVRGAERKSQIDKVAAGELFYANCDTFSRTVADMLVLEYDADPAEVWLVNVSLPVKGFVWINNGNSWHRVKEEPHQIVIYRDLAIDNRWGVVPVKDLEWEYRFNRKMNMKDQKWVAM